MSDTTKTNADWLSNTGQVRQRSVERIKAAIFEEAELRTEIRLDDIDPNPYQPRVDFSKAEDMAASLREHGQYYPILVRRKGDRYQVADGETRWRGAKLNLEIYGKKAPDSIGAVIKVYSDEDMALIAFRTAYERKDLNPIEEAQGIKRIHDELGISYEELAKKLSKPEHYLYERVRLLNLPEKLVEYVHERKITPSQAINIATVRKELPDEKAFNEFVEAAVEEKLSVHKIRERKKEAKTAVVPGPVDPEQAEVTKQLRELNQLWKVMSAAQRKKVLALIESFGIADKVEAKKPTPVSDKVIKLMGRRAQIPELVEDEPATLGSVLEPQPEPTT